MISRAIPVCDSSDERQAPRQASSLRAGTITATAGTGVSLGAAFIGRIGYYSFVLRAFLGVSLLSLTLTGCYSGTKPPHIGAPAPDFTAQDSEHKVTLSSLRGKVVVLNFWASWCPPCVEETPSLVR